MITPEFFYQLFNLILLIMIPVVIYCIIKDFKRKRDLVNKRISDLEKKIEDLENK